MKTEGNKTLLLVSDHGISAMIRELCAHHSDEVELHDNDDEAVAFACANTWDLLIIYSEAQSSTVIENCRHIKANNPFRQIIVVTGTADPAFNANCLHEGADDVITAPWYEAEFSARVNAAMRRSNQLQLQPNVVASSPAKVSLTSEDKPSYQYIGDVQLCPLKREVSVLGELVRLTRTEYVLLTYLLRRKNRPCSSVELLNNVLGYHDENYLPSLHSHISRLRGKIKRSNTTSIDTIWCYGYRIIIE